MPTKIFNIASDSVTYGQDDGIDVEFIAEGLQFNDSVPEMLARVESGIVLRRLC